MKPPFFPEAQSGPVFPQAQPEALPQMPQLEGLPELAPLEMPGVPIDPAPIARDRPTPRPGSRPGAVARAGRTGAPRTRAARP